MAQITFDRFDLGIDLRKGASVSDANRLLEMKNAYVTTGLATQKRPGLTLVQDLEPGTVGLGAAFGKLHTFYGPGSVTHSNPLFEAHAVPFSDDSGRQLLDVPFFDVFNGKIYVATEYEGGGRNHHYLDGSAQTHIADSNCPRTGGVVKAASKIFAVDGDVVRYCTTGNPRDWSSANDAGFLPTGLNARGDRNALALGIYQKNLAVLTKDGVQVWRADPDPAQMGLMHIVENVGTSFPMSIANVAGDLFFLSDYGFRSVTTLQLTQNLADVDVGSPIDPLIRPLTKTNIKPRAAYFYGTGQYVCAIGSDVFVYSLSRTARIAAWSRYVMPFPVDAFAQLGRTLYIRCGDKVYRLDDESSSDWGDPYEVVLQLPYMDLKAPGIRKVIYGMDVVMEGGAYVSIGYDERNRNLFTDEVYVEGNTRPQGMVSLMCDGTSFSLRFRNNDTRQFRLDAVTLYYDELGPV